ncbi:hypothetical protein [Gudongella oleilytica]|uniref:hypothetical protein n=1 Tax=Gudongella oleilytica TaxID=1582259 RepID=UPI002A36E430|nr:hypothetical protein [Gudongella oleilytica]MDY0255709.1 hypothetical protein [Gudongella oleilytica]
MVNIQFRAYFSIQHLKSAYLLGIESKKLEELDLTNICGSEKNDLISRNLAFVTGSLFASVSFLEATIREVICDIIDTKDRTLNIPTKDRDSVVVDWNKKSRDSLERLSILNKYQRTLSILNKVTFDSGSEIFIDLINVIEVRNALIHYTPEDYSIHSPFVSEINNQHALTEYLDGKFEHSVFFERTGNPFFPDKCLGYGFSRWTLENSIKFVNEFHNKIGLKPIYKQITEDIKL